MWRWHSMRWAATKSPWVTPSGWAPQPAWWPCSRPAGTAAVRTVASMLCCAAAAAAAANADAAAALAGHGGPKAKGGGPPVPGTAASGVGTVAECWVEVGTPCRLPASPPAHRNAGLPVDRLAAHMHDTYGQALANILTALQVCGAGWQKAASLPGGASLAGAGSSCWL